MSDLIPLQPQAKPTVFFSHSSADSEQISLIAEHARAAGVEPYMANHDYQPGRQLLDKIVKAIESSDAVFVFLTQSGYDSNYVHEEIGIAIGKNKLVIALVDPELQMGGGQDMATLAGTEVVPFSFAKPTIEHMAHLVAALHRITQQSNGSAILKMTSSGTLSLSVQADLKLTVDDVLKGVLVVGLVIGVIYLVSGPINR